MQTPKRPFNIEGITILKATQELMVVRGYSW